MGVDLTRGIESHPALFPSHEMNSFVIWSHNNVIIASSSKPTRPSYRKLKTLKL